jgi:hypothetical protein
MGQEYAIDRGGFHLSLIAGLENETPLPLPDKILKNYREKKGILEKTPIVEIPPHIQSIYVELARVTTALEHFSAQGTVLERAELERRMQALHHLKICLLLEFIPPEKFPPGKVNLSVGPGWKLYKVNPQQARQIKSRS